MLQKYPRIKGATHDYEVLQTLPDDDCNILIVSSRTLHLLANYARYEANWYARFLKDLGSGGMVVPIRAGDAETAFVDEVANRFRLEVIPVSCDFQTLADAINNVALALRSQNCTPSSQICVEAGDIGEDGTDQPAPTEGEFSPPDGNFPEGFDSLEDYLAAKCEVANWIFDRAITFLRTVGAIAAFQATGATIAVALAASAPAFLTPLAFIAVVALLVATLAAGLGSLSYMWDFADALEADRDEIICRLFQAQNTQNAVDSVIDRLEDLIEDFVFEVALGGALDAVLSNVLTGLATQFFNNNMLNKLFQLNLDITYAGADCSACGAEACAFTFVSGSGPLDYNNVETTLFSEDLGGGVHSLELTTACTDANWCVIFPEVPAGLVCPNPTNWNRRLYGTANGVNGYHNIGYENYDPNCFFPVGVQLPISGFSVANNAAFSLRLRIVKSAASVDNEPPETSTDCD